MNFSRSYRASIDRVEGIAFTVPRIEVQNEAMAKVRELGYRIAEAEKTLWICLLKKRPFSKSICSNDEMKRQVKWVCLPAKPAAF